MAWTPRLNVVCGRCGKPRGLTHTCFSSSKRKATVKAAWSFGKCPDCGKPYGGNPLTHACRSKKGDFGRRRGAFGKQEKARARREAAKKAAATRKKNAHDYQACSDGDCQRSLCVAYKTGYRLGDQDGYDRGFQLGWDRGFPAGQAACPRAHQ